MLNDVDHAVLVDAVQSSALPGTVYCIDDDDLLSFTSDSKSAHGWGLAETLRLGRQILKLKTKIRIVGIEAEQMTMGATLSQSVQDAVPTACEAIQDELTTLLKN